MICISFLFVSFLLLITGVQGLWQLDETETAVQLLLQQPGNYKLFVFGDSYADTGNKDSQASCWRPPYGITFPGIPAGRYSDGLILTDYIARFMGLQSPIPYRMRNSEGANLWNGVNFAYAGTGVFNTWNLDPNMTTQIDFFEKLIADSVYTKKDFQSSVAFVSLAGNDYGTYAAKGGSDEGLENFIELLVNQLALNLKRICGLGIRKIAVTALEPLGCLPSSTARFSHKHCNARMNDQLRSHNMLLQQVVAKLNKEYQDSTIFILDLYSSFLAAISNKGDLLGYNKFESPLKPCCVGISEEYNCGSLDERGLKMYSVCDHPEFAFFWDEDHPTQAGWGAVFSVLQLQFQLFNTN